MSALFRNALRTVVLPGKAFRLRLEGRRPVWGGFRAALLAGFLYALTSLGLAVSGAVPLAPALFGFSVENYYFWQMTLIIPGCLLGWLVAGWLIRMSGGGAGRKGLGRRALALAGPALAFPLFLAWIPQAVQAVLMILGMGQDEYVEIVSPAGLWQSLYVGFHLAGLAWGVVMNFQVARISQSAGRGKAIFAGLTVTAVLAGAFVLFVR